MSGDRTGSERSVLLHAYTLPTGSAFTTWLDAGRHFHGSFPSVVGPLDRLVARVTGPPEALAEAERGLPDGPARAEALAIRLRRSGHDLRWGPSDVLPSRGALLERARAHGASSVAVLDADPSLLPELRIGAWYESGWRSRALRRLLIRSSGGFRRLVHVPKPTLWRTAIDWAFWSGVRSAADDARWARLSASSYVALCYHRFAGEGRPGQERLDLPSGTFARQLRTLRRLGYRPLGAHEVVAFHRGPDVTLPRRRFVVTVDDGYRDNVGVLQRHADAHPQLFVPTAEVGRSARWTDGEPLASWDELRAMARAGVRIGSHSRTHAVLPSCDEVTLGHELLGSLSELEAELPQPFRALAYPHGRHDPAVVARTQAAGYEIAYTTELGRNAAGTDRYCLRRVRIAAYDTLPAFLWKTLTGEQPPRRWERRLRRRAGLPATSAARA